MLDATPKLTPKQIEARKLLNGPAKHILLRGGSRSGKTFILCRNILARAGKAPGSTHTILREHFNHLKHSIIFDTMPKVLKICWPMAVMRLDKTDWFHELPNGSKIIYGGLDDKERTEKILGQEHSTLALNECSQITYGARNKAITRLAQNSGLALKAYYDCNPPTKGHWTYSLFMKKQEPTSGEALANPENYATMQMNPGDNLANLPPDYVAELNALPARDRVRFLAGEFADQVENALWDLDALQRMAMPKTERERDAFLAKMRRVVVAIDPSGCDGDEDTRSDEIGIVVAGIDYEGIGYVLEDASGHYSPEAWARKALDLFDAWRADTIIGEINYGGDMIRAVIQAARKSAPFKKITASRGKHVRAEPISSEYERKRVKHVGRFPDLEEQYGNFSTSGYGGEHSPDRADAAIFALTELMLGKQTRVGLF